MTTLREAAQQALTILEAWKHKGMWGDWDGVTDALKAALVEDAMQKFTDVNQELMAALGCDHCNSPLYVATRCRVCGRVTEPVQEPVAWIHTDPDKPRVRFLQWRKDEPGYRGRWIKTPLFIAPLGCPNCASLQDQNTELDRKLAELDTDLRAQL